MEYLDSEMRTHSVFKVVIITSYGHYGNDNRYTIHCVKSDPRNFVGSGLLVCAHALIDLPTLSCRRCLPCHLPLFKAAWPPKLLTVCSSTS